MLFTVSGKLLDTCVLGVIRKKDTYGYDLTQNVGQVVDVSESALYPVLRRLLKDGLLTSYDVPYEGRNRKYYKITTLGIEQLDIYLSEWDKYKETINNLVSRGDNNE